MNVPIELWLIRHGESKNNEILSRAGGLGAIAYPIEFTQDPILTHKGALVAAENGQRLVDCNVKFDLCLCSSMVRTMETAFFMLVKSKLCSTIYIVPHMSEIPLKAGIIPIYENMPLRRDKQIEKLGKCHGSEILEAMNWDLVGGAEGKNDDTLPPNGQKFYDFLFKQEIVLKLLRENPGRKLRIAVVTHSNLLKQILSLDIKPANADIWVADLQVSRVSMGCDGKEDEFVSLGEFQPWFQEQIAIKRKALARKIARVASRTERKVFKYETKLFKLKHGLDEEVGVPARIAKKESKLTQHLEKKRNKYERKLKKLEAKMEHRATNQSDRDLANAREASSGVLISDLDNAEEEEEEAALERQIDEELAVEGFESSDDSSG